MRSASQGEAESVTGRQDTAVARTAVGGRKTIVLVCLPVILGVAIGAWLRTEGLLPYPEIDIRWRIPAIEADSYRPGGRLTSGEEIALVYVGSSDCVWSNTPELPSLIQALKLDFQARAIEEPWEFVAVGIARDIDPANGIAHLKRFGAFDEVMTGRSWANIGLLKYIYGDMPGRAATPQMLVVSRRFQSDGGHYGLLDERVLVRVIGLDEIKAWASAGASWDAG